LRGASDQALQTYSDGSQVNLTKSVSTAGGGIYETSRIGTRQTAVSESAYVSATIAGLQQPGYVMLQQGGNVDVAFRCADCGKASDNPTATPWAGLSTIKRSTIGHHLSRKPEATTRHPLFNFHWDSPTPRAIKPLSPQTTRRVMKLKPLPRRRSTPQALVNQR